MKRTARRTGTNNQQPVFFAARGFAICKRLPRFRQAASGSLGALAAAAPNFPDMISNRVTVLEDKSDTEKGDWEDRRTGIACRMSKPALHGFD
jgi:hypothetical protein